MVDFYSITLHLNKKGLNATDAHAELLNIWHSQAPPYSTITRWFRQFATEKPNLKVDNPISKKPKKSIELIRSQIKTLISNNPHISIRMIAQNLNLPATSTWEIMTSQLGFTKICSTWVPHRLQCMSPVNATIYGKFYYVNI